MMVPKQIDWTIVAGAGVKAAQAILAALVAVGIVTLDATQLGTIILAVEAIIGLPLSYLGAARTTSTSPTTPILPSNGP